MAMVAENWYTPKIMSAAAVFTSGLMHSDAEITLPHSERQVISLHAVNLRRRPELKAVVFNFETLKVEELVLSANQPLSVLL